MVTKNLLFEKNDKSCIVIWTVRAFGNFKGPFSLILLPVEKFPGTQPPTGFVFPGCDNPNSLKTQVMIYVEGEKSQICLTS